MSRIRALVNAELIAEDKNGKEKTVQIGAGTNFEAKSVEVFDEDNETFADITLLDGSKIFGVVWNKHTFENHGVHETRIIKKATGDFIDSKSDYVPAMVTNESVVSKESANIALEKLKEINDKPKSK